MESGFEVFYYSITCGVWGMEFFFCFLFLVSWVEEYLLHWSFSFSLPCLTLLLGVVRVCVHTAVVFNYHKSSDTSSLSRSFL